MAGNRIRQLIGVALALSALAGRAACAEPVKGSVRVTNESGYTRIVLRFDEDVPAKVSMAGAVLIINFEKPVAVAVDNINASAPGYISAARQDPDGSAIRIALARKVKVSSIPAGERLYVDLLPETWTGVPPGLPQEVIDDLARRARDAEKQLRKAQLAAKPRNQYSVRLKVGAQPTFVRYVFELPPLTNVTPEQTPDKITLNFDQSIDFDVADARATMPSTVTAIDTEREHDSSMVSFTIKGQPKIRAFREDRNFIVDVGTADQSAGDEVVPPAADKAAPAAKAAKAAPAIAAPETTPAAAEAPPKAEAPAQPKPAAEPAKPPVPQTKAQAEPAKAPAPAPEPAAPPMPPNMTSQAMIVPTPPPKPKAQPAASQLAAEPGSPITVSLHRQGQNLRLDFPFAVATPAAVFRRANALWLIFDSAARLNLAALKDDTSISRAALVPGADNEVVLRLELEKPQLVSFFPEGTGWVMALGNTVVEPTAPVSVARSIVGKGRATITIPFAEPRALHRISDPEVGDTLLVITALGPARGFVKAQEFVELRALASTHGIVVQPLADDVNVELATDKVVISRPGGLSLSSATVQNRDKSAAALFQPMMFDAQTWGFDREAPFAKRENELINRAASAPDNKRRAARLDLARFYLARDMAAEAKGVLDVVTADEREGEGTTGSVLRAVANVMLGRADEALKDLGGSQIGNNSDAPIWRAMAHARQGRFAQAREEFRNVDVAVGALPIELQRLAKREALRCSIEVRDFSGASILLNDFETIGVPPEMAPSLAVMTGRLEEGLGRTADALAAYRRAAMSKDRKNAAQGHLRDLVLRNKIGDLKRSDMVDQLETLTTTWRGDETEAEGLQHLAHFYTEDKRYRDAFHVMRTALLAHPNSDLTRKIQDEAAATFDSLFLTTEFDALPAIQALGLFYDYKELTPIGRRGDEMIRRLADRLVSVDLLDQAGELLQHQVDHRLTGAARAQVATRLATVYLMNRKPDRALATLQRTRTSDMAGDLREQRLLLEARAMSDGGRHELALEVIAGMKGREAMRLRADVLWAAKKWREAGEAFELFYGHRWQDSSPLNTTERNDILRAAISFALAEDQMGLNRFREKYAERMAEGADRRAFEVVTAPIGSGSSEFRAVTSAVVNTSTLDAFLADLRKRFPEKEEPADDTARGPETAPAKLNGEKAASALPPKPPAGTPANADKTPTGSISRQPRRISR
jgi:hypothetical protein